MPRGPVKYPCISLNRAAVLEREPAEPISKTLDSDPEDSRSDADPDVSTCNRGTTTATAFIPAMSIPRGSMRDLS
jgi:hypothetical protein